MSIPEAAIASLEEAIHGKVLRPGTDGFDDARRVWNAMVDKHPGVIVQCSGVADVISTVNTAREHGVPLAIKAGGHNVSGKAVCNGGIVLDLALMNSVRVDPTARRARAGAGAKWRDFDHEAQAFGLTTTGGVVSSTGVAGLTLGGGIGYLTRTYGLSCDNVTSMDVVTAAGELVQASETENADLFWALRGGGGNFGVVTSLEFKLHEVGPILACGVVFYPMTAAAEVLRSYRTFASAAPDAVACYAMMVNAPPDLAAAQGRPVLAIVSCYSGDVEAGKRALAPTAEWGEPLLAVIDGTPYLAQQQAFDAGNPHGARYYWKSQHLGELADGLLDTLVEFATDMHGEYTIIGIEPLGGAQGRVAADATAFAFRDVPFSLGIWTGWDSAEDDDVNIAWTRRFYEAVKSYGVGVYVNYLDQDEPARVSEAYGGNYERLAEVKSKWDPDNLFRENHNISR